jgi:hypothetical protein
MYDGEGGFVRVVTCVIGSGRLTCATSSGEMLPENTCSTSSEPASERVRERDGASENGRG